LSAARYDPLQPVGPQLQRLPFLTLVGVLDINAKSYSGFGGCAVIGDVTEDDWCNAKFCHLRKCGAAQIVRRPMLPSLKLLTDNATHMVRAYAPYSAIFLVGGGLADKLKSQR
jgi:hypothetical protein